jgi:iron complex outermembrane receptor protein
LIKRLTKQYSFGSFKKQTNKQPITYVIQGVNMYNNSKVAKAIRIAMMFGAGAAAAISAPTFAVEEGAEEVEKIEVTGSRIKRSDLEGASPVTVITAADMKIEGNLTVADALRNSNLNSFGSFSERSGSSAQSQATIDLRGAGSQRTLVLIDGKRFPGSPTLGGGSANLNAIPMAAVERIEILTDGASSVYGSDAMAGVVNIIMKKNYEGLTFSVGAGSRDRDEGVNTKDFSIVGGWQTDKGGVTFAVDSVTRDGIADRDREFSAPWQKDFNGDGEINIYTETDGWSYYGANVKHPDTGIYQPSPLCDDLIAKYGNDTFAHMSGDDVFGEGSDMCAYAYGNVSINKTDMQRNTVYVDADYDLSDDIEWFGRVMFTQSSTKGRYAPPAAPWNKMAADSPHNPHGVEAKGYFRWVDIGTRDGNTDDYNQDFITGLRGDLDFLNATWEVYYHYNKADNKNIGEFYLSYSGLAYNEANGIDLGSEAGVNNMKATTLTQSSSEFNQYNAGLNFDLFTLPGGDVAHFVGMEYFDVTYSDIYDAQSEAGLIGGSAGNSAAGSREVFAVFYEAILPVVDDVEINIAGRYDDYSDFGGNFAPKVAVRWQALDSVVFRASYSEAFRAPGLDELNAATTYSASTGIDKPFCAARGTAIADCPAKQYDTYISANKELQPETSEYINLGIAWDISDDFGLSVDYFDLTIDNVIASRSITNVMTGIDSGTLTPSNTFYVKRSPSVNGLIGAADEIGTGTGNGNKMQIAGIDVAFNGAIETGFGDFSVKWNNSFVKDYIVEVEGGGTPINTAGWSGQPQLKSVLTTTYSVGDHSLTWNINYTDSTYEDSADDIPSGHLDSWTIHNVSYMYDIGSYGQVLLGINNLADEDPILSVDGKYENASLYNNYGREYTARYTISF